MISNRALTALLLIAALVVLASPAAAQYMYLDSNGNGVHDSGDRLAPTGVPTTVDVWVVTDHNRDGSPVVCPQDPDAPMTLVSYVVNLAASGGTASYGGFTTHIGNVAFGEFNPGDGTNYKNGFGLTFFSPPGTYRLCTLTITGLAGTPRIDIVDQVPGSTSVGGGPIVTSFGSACFGNEFDNTYKLAGPQGGSDWTDVDGLDMFVIDEGTPVLAAIGNKTVNEGDCLTFTATATAPGGNPVSFSLTGQSPAGASITTAGQFNWCPTEAQGPGVYPITVTVTDNGTGNLSDSETIQVTVNEVNLAPALNPIGNKTAALASLLTFTATATDADIPSQTLTFSLDPGAPAGATIGAATGVFSWTPNVSGTSPVTIRVTDNGTPPLSDSETILIVTCVCSNTPPTLGPIGNKTVNELALLSFTATATDADIPAQTLTFSLGAGAPAGAAITAGGAFTWTPTEAQGPGVYPITVIVTDNGVANFSDSETIQITVLEVNQAPVVTNPGNKTADEGLLLSFNVVATDADLPAQALTFSLSSPIPPGASITSGGTFRWTPAENEGGIDWPVTVCVNDGATGLTDCETINITVIENNIAPVLASIGTKVVAPGATLSFVATATDADIPAQTLTFSLDPGAPPGASITALGAFTWTTGSIGMFPITIRVTDNGSTPVSDSETFLVVVGQGSPPVLNPIADMTVNEGTVGTQTISASDPDNQSLQFSKQSGPFWVSIQTVGPTTGLVTASPDLSAGSASYPVTAYVTDGLLSDQRSFMVQVTESCSPPVADAGGPYSGVTWFPVTFDGTASTDPDGDIQAYGWDFGDGLTAGGATVMHAYLQPGTYTVVLYVSDVCSGTSDSDQTSVTISDCYSTLAFVAGGNKQINLLNEKPTWCVQLEPFGGTFDVATIDPSSLVMRSTGTGAVSEIHALTDKTSVGGDRNGNGYTELSACFRKEDLRQLFSEVTGTQQVQVTFEGNLLVGGRTCSNLTITVKGGGGAVLAASISPNPLNPSAVLTFSTQERGPVLVQLFDVRGRLLRTLRDEADAPAGYHDVRIDGTTANGTRLSSGIYYVRIRAGAEEERKAITILK